jgi:hypothetical protein
MMGVWWPVSVVSVLPAWLAYGLWGLVRVEDAWVQGQQFVVAGEPGEVERCPAATTGWTFTSVRADLDQMRVYADQNGDTRCFI